MSSSGSRTAIGDAAGSRSQLFSLVSLGRWCWCCWCCGRCWPCSRARPGGDRGLCRLRLIDLGEFRRLRHFKASEFQLALVTLAGVLFTDLLRGVALAVALSVLNLFARLARPNDAVLGSVPGWRACTTSATGRARPPCPGLVIYR